MSPNHAQSAAGLEGIIWAFIWAPALLFALAAIPLLFFRKYEAMEEKIRHDLETVNS
ncbi:Inner membrane symporter yihP [Salmonella enterica subsp. enterica]|uniref:Inner membrane symporter yihP n=1 Tax=Salmonella enterica I TaxID=59201 RepID=A0A379VYW1_SALET|nr:Inner membrane symporter yihP [Salmonella enterica subsp. enterica]